MLVVTNKRPKTVLVKKDSVAQAGNFLDSLPEKPKETFSLRSAVDRLREPIRAALAKGYTYDEVAALLAKQGISISPSTLKNYVPSGSRQATKTKMAGAKTRQTKVNREATKASVAPTPLKPVTQTKSNDRQSSDKVTDIQPAKQRTRATAAKTKVEPSTKAKTPAKQPSSKPTTATKSTRGTRKSTSATSRKKST